VAAIVPVVADMAANFDAPKATDVQALDEGSVLAVQVTPSGEVAAAVEPEATTRNVLFP
jgi:hypothetical protein